MVVGVVTWEMEIFGCQSLKQKRSVVRSLKDRLRNKLNVAVAETGHTDLWQRAEITACAVSNERGHVDSILESADRFMASDPRARVIRANRMFL
jgi:uncharacterized protein YlxP (DUF503 family)